MAAPTIPLGPDALSLATFLVNELDRHTRDVARTRVMPTMRAAAEGRADATLLALAYMRGYYGWSRTEAFIRHVRNLTPRPTLVTAEPAGDRPVAEADRNGISDPISESEARVLDGDR